MVTELPTNGDTQAPPVPVMDADTEAEDALRLWRAFASLRDARRAVRTDPTEVTIAALCAAQAAWSDVQAELQAPAPPPERPRES